MSPPDRPRGGTVPLSVDFRKLSVAAADEGSMPPTAPDSDRTPASQAPTTLDPKLDVVFKLLFSRNEDLLISLLTAVLRPEVPIASVTYRDRALPKSTVLDKGGFLDVLVELENGRLVDVEMQCRSHPGLRRRALSYWARLYGSRGEKGLLYRHWPPCVCIFILAFPELPGDRFHRIFQVRDVDDGELFSDALELHTVELPKLPDADGDLAEVDLERWGRFLAADTDAEREALAMSDPVIGKAKEALDLLSADPTAQEVARQRERARLSYEFEMAESRREGIEQGIEQGEAALRLAVQRLCDSLEVPLTKEREHALRVMKLDDLERLHDRLCADRRWPDD